MHGNIHNFINYHTATFNIIEEFAALNAQRKLSLCDRLFSEGSESYKKAARLLWSQATSEDLTKLEKFLSLLKKSAH